MRLHLMERVFALTAALSMRRYLSKENGTNNLLSGLSGAETRMVCSFFRCYIAKTRSTCRLLEKNAPKSDKKPKRDKRLAKTSKEAKDVSSVSTPVVHSTDRADGTGTTPATGLVGVSTSAASSSQQRPGPGGRPVEVGRSNAESGRGEVHSGQPPAAEVVQPQPLTEPKLPPSDIPSTTIEPTVSNHQFIADENASLGGNLTERTNSDQICRICHETDQLEPLMSPCWCRGSLSLVHRSCLQHWLAESDSSVCELCRFGYITKRVPKYSLFGSFFAWVRINRRQRRTLILDAVSLLAFVPIATIITYAAASLADGIEYQEAPSLAEVAMRFAIVSLISVMTTFDVAFATWGLLRLQHHFTTWYSWYRRNSDVTLISQIDPDNTN